MKFPYQGEIFSILSALAWAIAVILFRLSGQKVSPLALNLFKSSLASFLLLASAWLLVPNGCLQNGKNFIILVISGFFGITLSDTLFFFCLNKVGASLTAIIECLYSPFVIWLSRIFLGEEMRWRQILGVGLILAAVILISWPRPKKSVRVHGQTKIDHLIAGIIAGSLSMLFMAIGIVLIKPLLSKTPIFWAAAIRMSSGAFFLLLFLPFFRQRKELLHLLFTISNWPIMIIATFIGAYGGLIAWVAGMKFTNASIAAALNQLSSIFIFLLAVIFLKEKITSRQVAALIMAFIGAFLASWR